MNKQERNDMLYALIVNYVNAKMQDKIWQRDHSREYLFASGKLIGACMALEYDFSELYIEEIGCHTLKITNIKSGREIVRYSWWDDEIERNN